MNEPRARTMTERALPTVSVDEYMASLAHDETKSEYVDGVVYAMSGGSFDHSRIGRNAVTLFDQYLDPLACEAVNSDLLLQITPSICRFPDAMVTCDERDRRRGQAMFIEHPKLIVEVLSDSTEATDRGRKFEEYRQIPEFEEYLLLASDRVAADHFRRGEGDLWLFRGYSSGDDTITLQSIGLTCPLHAFYRGTSLLGSAVQH